MSCGRISEIERDMEESIRLSQPFFKLRRSKKFIPFLNFLFLILRFLLFLETFMINRRLSCDTSMYSEKKLNIFDVNVYRIVVLKNTKFVLNTKTVHWKNFSKTLLCETIYCKQFVFYSYLMRPFRPVFQKQKQLEFFCLCFLSFTKTWYKNHVNRSIFQSYPE